MEEFITVRNYLKKNIERENFGCDLYYGFIRMDSRKLICNYKVKGKKHTIGRKGLSL